MEELENGVVVDTAAEPAEPQEQISYAGPEIGTPTTEENAATSQPAEPEIPNEVWATARRRAEQEAAQRYAPDLALLQQERAERERIAAENQRLTSVLQDSGFTGNALDIADRIEADRRGVLPEQVKLERIQRDQQLAEEIKRRRDSDPEFLRLKQNESQLTQFAAEKIRQDDLAAIKAHNPKEAIKSVNDLGALFGTLRVQGLSAVDAYEAVRAVNSRKQPPKSMGGIESQTEKQATNRYASMSQADFEKEIARAERGELKRG